jgi:hypothetical protein
VESAPRHQNIDATQDRLPHCSILCPTIAVVRTPPTHFHREAIAGTLLGVGGPLRGFAAPAPYTL